MANLLALGSRPLASPVLPAAAQAGGKTAGAQTAPASGKLAARLPVVEAAAFQNDSVTLSKQSLERAEKAGAKTVDVAEKFINTFIKRLFGDAAKGASAEFDAVSLEAQSSYSAALEQSSGTDGRVSTASFSLNESAHFIGTGQIVTDDGQTFDFEIEVTYEASVEASATQASSQPATVEAPDVLALTGKPLPAIEFPGSLNDLFKLLGRQLSSDLDGHSGRSDEAQAGNLSLRLLRLVDRAALLAPRAHADEPAATPADRSKAAAYAYSSTAASSDIASA